MESMDAQNARAAPASARDISRRCNFAPHFAVGYLAGRLGRLAITLADSQTRWPTDWRRNRERRAFVRFASARFYAEPAWSMQLQQALILGTASKGDQRRDFRPRG